MTINRIWPPPGDDPPHDDPLLYNDGYDPHPRAVNYCHRDGPMLTPYHETIITTEAFLLTSIGGETKLERAAVDIALALIQTEAMVLSELLANPEVQIELGKAAAKIASTVLATAGNIQRPVPGDQGK